jgi:hypothetical protein
LFARGVGTTLNVVPEGELYHSMLAVSSVFPPVCKLGTDMARKNKRSRQRKPQRGPGGPISRMPGAMPRPLASGEPVAVPPPARPIRGRGTLPIPLTEQDAAIPMERVPYFRSDLRRIAITAAAMFALLVIGSFFIR